VAIVDSSGVRFGSTATGKHYISLHYHRGPAAAGNPKSKWLSTVTPSNEYAMFELADTNGWADAGSTYWTVKDGGTEVGQRGERIGKHPGPTDLRDPWHGYPASPSMKGAPDAPPDAVIEAWLKLGIVDRTFARRLQRWRI